MMRSTMFSVFAGLFLFAAPAWAQVSTPQLPENTATGTDATSDAVEAMEETTEAVGEAAGTVGNAAADAASTVGKAAGDAAGTVGEAVGDAADSVGQAAGKAAGTLEKAAEEAVGTLEKAAEAGAEGVVSTADWIVIKFGETGEAIGGMVSSAYESAERLVEAAPVSLTGEQVAGIAVGIVAGALMAELLGASGFAAAALIAGGAAVGNAVTVDAQ